MRGGESGAIKKGDVFGDGSENPRRISRFFSLAMRVKKDPILYPAFTVRLIPYHSRDSRIDTVLHTCPRERNPASKKDGRARIQPSP